MRWRGWKAVVLVTVMLMTMGLGVWGRSGSGKAYVTLLYGDEFLLGVRVLGKSIENTGTTEDRIVLVSDGVSDYAKKLLQADGWIVELISLLANPNQVRPKRFWGVYTKLKIFNLTKYKKVVYLDADTIVLKDIDDLFKCGRFCANLKHSERLNSGVMVVEPSENLFNDMMSKVNSLYSYTGGDQGFLNSYYKGFPNAHVFMPNVSSDRKIPEMERLSTLYNADVGLYMLANKWMVDEKDLRIIHYTLGPLKPWDWWTAWLLKPVDVWQNVRKQLNPSLPGTEGGRNPNEQFFVKILFVLPLCILLFICYRSFLKTNNNSVFRCSICDHAKRIYYNYKSGSGHSVYSGLNVNSSISNSNHQFSNNTNIKLPANLGLISVLVCFLAAMLSFGFAFSLIPHQVMPWTGLILLYEWTFTLFFIIFGSYLSLVYKWGNRSTSQIGSSDSDSRKGQRRQISNCDSFSWIYGLGMAFLAIIVPSLPSLFGISALFARLGLMVGGGIVLSSFMTYSSEHLAIRAFMRGSEDHDQTKNRNSCLPL
ncbi:putative glucuronosyltransferase PGSIP6 [Zostera marina]|uniref:Hexosyltransferase n=1 Tax=Zostera marina TaxID=29655 RepID=A0A0K9Q6C0_ZOSMR|nr:putative glucuronosyltransferase PGSIP6 [Zostera marina]